LQQPPATALGEFLGRITAEITEPTGSRKPQKADDQTQLERTRLELSKRLKNS
jgi:hypothetical protein